MKKNQSVEFIRSIAMLGVLAIHTGAYSLTNPYINVPFFFILEILSRFSIPAFFFMSAFGLFWNFKIKQPTFNYLSFLKKRLYTIIIPYLTWSFLYLTYYTYTFNDFSVWLLPNLLKTLFLGNASYQLYFLIILLWFYILMPIWQKLIPFVAKYYQIALPVLFILQVILNFYLSYLWKPHFENFFLKMLWDYRLNYLFAYYFFIFILGGICSLHFHNLTHYFKTHKKTVTLTFSFSLFLMIASFFYLTGIRHYSLLETVFTLHQHSPPGILYSVFTCLFLLMFFTNFQLPSLFENFFGLLAKQSYFIYLFHPFAMYFLLKLMLKYNLLFTSFNTFCFFFFSLCLSSLFAFILSKVAYFFPHLNLLLIGKKNL